MLVAQAKQLGVSKLQGVWMGCVPVPQQPAAGLDCTDSSLHSHPATGSSAAAETALCSRSAGKSSSALCVQDEGFSLDAPGTAQPAEAAAPQNRPSWGRRRRRGQPSDELRQLVSLLLWLGLLPFVHCKHALPGKPASCYGCLQVQLLWMLTGPANESAMLHPVAECSACGALCTASS